jgi:murein DD-endopeptidase MepM/ murein hydrolase activator NlpD
VRLFPRAAGRRLSTALVLCGLVVGVTAVPFAQADDRADDLKHRQKKVQKHLEHAHDDLEESSTRLVKATRALDAARAELSDAKTELDDVRTQLAEARVRDLEMQGQLTQAEADLDYAELAVTAGTAAVGRQRDSVASLISNIYTEGDPDLLAVSSLLDAETPADLIRSAQGRQVIVGEQTRTYDDLSAAEVLLEVQQDQVADARRAVAAKAKEAADQVLVMQGLEEQTQTAKDEVVRLVSDRKVANTEAKAAKASDRKKLRKLKKEDRRLKDRLAELARRARLRALRQGQPTAPSDSGGFLNRPVPGAVTSPFGMRSHPIYGYWGLHDGTDFGVSCGEPMYAAADGRVIESYYQTAYGNRLVIDNGFQRGVGLATIYNHATSYTVGVGDQVSRGQVVGYVGSTGWSTGCHLHFTVMANGRPVDPMGWL